MRDTVRPSMTQKKTLALVLLLTGGGATAHAQESELASLAAAARAGARDASAQRAYGIALLRAGRYREAEQQLTRASRVARGSLESLFDVARVPIAQGDHRAAERACRALAHADEHSPLVQVCNARADLVWNRSGRAFESLTAALAAAPEEYEALYALGEAHRRRADVPEAEAAYHHASRARPTEAEPHLGLGLLYLAAGRHDDGVRELRRAHELDGTHPDVLFELGRALSGAGESRALLERAVASRQSWPEAQVALGEAQLEAGDSSAAESSFRAAIRRMPDFAPAHRGLGIALARRGDAAAAEAELRAALRIVANDRQASMALADVLSHTDRVEEAIEQYRATADLDPNDATALVAAADLAIRNRRDVLASGFLDRLTGERANLAATLTAWGDVMRLRNERERAREYYQRALRGTGPVDRARIETGLSAVR
jgi:tetratricopeptide (TPR) repeat protein